jgi:PAS domain S-box-containing protein
MATRKPAAKKQSMTIGELRTENEELRRRLDEADETIRAIQSGAVDAFVVEGPAGHRIYTLEAVDRPYRLFVEQMQQGAATLHGDGTIMYCNQRLADLLKIPHEKLIGAALHDFIPSEDRSVYDNLLWQCQTGSGRGEARLRRGDGELVPAYLTFNGLPEECGAVRGVLVTDLTSQRHHDQLAAAHKALGEREEALREADRRKDEFLAMLGHELRNPLGIISTSAQILRRLAPVDAKTEELRDTIERQVIHTSRMLDDLLDVSRISRGKIQLYKQRWNLRDIVHQTVEDHRPTLQENSLRLKLDIPDAPLPIFADRTRLSQALGNLLHNACKFTKSGGVVTVRLESEKSTNALLSVTDTGMGMDAEALGWVFEPFRQADRTLDRSLGGLGLGLALVKGIVELHGGEVMASSAGPERGSTFSIRLPLSHIEAASASAEVDQELECPAYRVLVIEDNIIAARNLRKLLELSGHTVETAHSGPEGVGAAFKFGPQIVLCDIGLPGMDGYNVAQALRQEAGLTDAYLIAVSGYAHDERRAQEAGFDAHIIKPVNFDALEAILAGLHPRVKVPLTE